jgi:hypothetical protein
MSNTAKRRWVKLIATWFVESEQPIMADDVYAPPPSVFPAPPRRVRLRPLPKLPLFFLLLFGGIGAAMFGLWFGDLAFVKAGRAYGITVPGRVTDKTGYGRRKAEHKIAFTYQVNGVDHASRMRVDDESAALVKVGDPVQVAVLSDWPDISASIVEPKLAAPWSDFCFTGFVCLWNGMVLVLVMSLLRRVMAWRRLARQGTPTAGLILDKKMTGGRTGTYLLTYQYQSDRGPHEAVMSVRAADYEALEVGARVTVLYDPGNPEHSLIYRCGEFFIDG